MIYPVILCGGSGTRLWPTSRKAFPKQFSKLIGEDTLFQTTLKRFTGPDFAAPLIMTNAAWRIGLCLCTRGIHRHFAQSNKRLCYLTGIDLAEIGYTCSERVV